MTDRLDVPLFPLPNVVHFPHTRLRLHVFEPRYRQLVHDLGERDEGERLIGMVVLRPREPASGLPPIYPAGTAGLLTEVEPLADGRSNIVLEGQFRFEIDRELLTPSPYREARVRRIEEPGLDAGDPGVATLFQELSESAAALAREIGERFPVAADDHDLASPETLEVLVNRLCAGLELPPLQKLQLLADPLPRRALNILAVLRGRRRTLDLLRPYRHLAAGADHN